MKYKKVMILFALFFVICGITYCSADPANTSIGSLTSNGHESEDINTSRFKWLKQYPQLVNINANNQTETIDKLRTSESISNLIGKITNPYGVRDDILDYIVQSVPKDNPKALQAAITSAYYDNLTYYSELDSDKLLYIKRGSLAMKCVFYFYNKYGSSDPSFLLEVDKTMRNTSARNSYMNNVDYNVFGWHLIGSGLGVNDEEEMCKTGGYINWKIK